MKKISSSMTARATIGALFFVIGIFLVVFALFTTGLRSATPSAGTLNPGGPTVSWAGTAAGGGSLDESTCVEGVNCDTFILTLSGTPTNWTGLKARIVVGCADPSGASDYDVYVHKGDNTGPIVPGGQSRQCNIDISSICFGSLGASGHWPEDRIRKLRAARNSGAGCLKQSGSNRAYR